MARERNWTWLFGAAVGAAAMYYLDPRLGRRRRTLLRQRLIHTWRTLEGSAQEVTHDLENRARGTAARARRRFRGEPPVDPEKLQARVRARLGHLARNAAAIHVEVREGRVILTGPVLASELGDVLAGIRQVPGVEEVESHLTPVESPARLRGLRARVAATAERLERPLPPAGRAMLGLSGGALALWGLRRGGAAGALASAAGSWMFARALANVATSRLVGVARHPVVVHRTMEIAAPVQRVFAFWSAFRNFPRFMAHLREVREMEGGISQWVAEGPAGVPVSWQAEITALQPHRRIAWRSLPGSRIENAGEVQFEEVDGRTRLHLRMEYSPPAGAVGQAVATLFGADPARQIDEDLRRVKALLEREAATAGREPDTAAPAPAASAESARP